MDGFEGHGNMLGCHRDGGGCNGNVLGNRNETVCHINVLEYHMYGDRGHRYALGGNLCEVRSHNNMLGGHMDGIRGHIIMLGCHMDLVVGHSNMLCGTWMALNVIN